MFLDATSGLQDRRATAIGATADARLPSRRGKSALTKSGMDIMGTATKQAEGATLPKLAAGFEPSVPIRALYDNWIAGEYVAKRVRYFLM